MIDLGLQTDLNRLHSAIDHSRDAAEPFRRNRKRMMKEFVGSHYNDNGASHEVLVNLLAMTADVYTIGLAAGSPCVSITTPHRELWPFAYQWQQAINSFVKEIRFAETHQQIVLDAFSHSVLQRFIRPNGSRFSLMKIYGLIPVVHILAEFHPMTSAWT